MIHDVDKMKREIAEHKAERVAKGLPAEMPPRLVEDEHSLRIFNETRPLYVFIVEYTQLLAKAGQVVPYDVEPYNKYIRMLKVMGEAQEILLGFYADGLNGALSAIKEMLNGNVPYDKALRDIYTCLSLSGIVSPNCVKAKAYVGDDLDDILTDYEGRIAAQEAEEERLEREFMERKVNVND